MRATHHDPLGRLPAAILAFLTMGLALYAQLAFGSGKFLLGLLGLAGGLFAWRRWRERRVGSSAEPDVTELRRRLSVAVKRWNAICHDERFEKRLAELHDLKRRLLELPKERDVRLKSLAGDLMKQQRDEFLDRFRIDKAKLRSVTPQDLAQLASWGIETAEDYLRLAGNVHAWIPRPTLLEIGQWAHDRAAEFRFDPGRVSESETVRQYEASLSAQQSRLLATLESGEAELKALAESIAAQRAETGLELADARRAVQAAESQRS